MVGNHGEVEHLVLAGRKYHIFSWISFVSHVFSEFTHTHNTPF